MTVTIIANQDNLLLQYFGYLLAISILIRKYRYIDMLFITIKYINTMYESYNNEIEVPNTLQEYNLQIKSDQYQKLYTSAILRN